ncbi:Gfo/Idh/MocA family protein [Bacteroidota bacterium]
MSGSAHIDRRAFLKLGAGGAAATALVAACSNETTQHHQAVPPSGLGEAPVNLLAAPAIDLVRIGFVGVGGMGSVHVQNLLQIEGVQIKAVCDIREEHARRARNLIVESGQPEPTLYTRGETDFERMCSEEDLDLVYNATPWKWHVPISVAAMRNGKHAATEVPAALTIEECWQLVEESEKHQKHCVMMENCNYGRAELLAFNLVRNGLLGEILHGECGYLHDLRSVKFSSEGEGLWRRAHSWTRNGNLYPTHGLGPVAQCMDIHRGDRLATLVSFSSPSRGLQAYARDHFDENAPQLRETYALGDINVSLIQTALGRTIYLNHDTNLPRPYSRINKVQGTRGLFHGYPDRVHIESRTPEHAWEDAATYYDEFEHPLWRKFGARDQDVGHGSMDFIEDYRLIECLRAGLPTDTTVYDAAAISAVSELSELSVANGGAPVAFPDFTRGQWRSYPKLEIVGT